jgi:hypothetical protein
MTAMPSHVIAYAIGVGLALAVGLGARLVGFDRDRSFYPVILCLVASYYGLFAVLGGAPGESVAEFVVIGGFLGLVVGGFKKTLWLIVAGLFAHGVFDFYHARLLSNPGVPPWWPAFCMSYDVTAAAYLAWLLRERQPRAEVVARFIHTPPCGHPSEEGI